VGFFGVDVLYPVREIILVQCAYPKTRHGNAVTFACALHSVGELWNANMPFVFSHVEYCDMHFVYGFCDVNANASVEEYRRRYPERRIPSRGVFTRVQQTLRDYSCLPSVAVQSERENVRTINTRENIFEMVQRSPRLSTRWVASCIGVSRMQVRRTLCEDDIYPYHNKMVQHLEQGDQA